MALADRDDVERPTRLGSLFGVPWRVVWAGLGIALIVLAIVKIVQVAAPN